MSDDEAFFWVAIATISRTYCVCDQSALKNSDSFCGLKLIRKYTKDDVWFGMANAQNKCLVVHNLIERSERRRKGRRRRCPNILNKTRPWNIQKLLGRSENEEENSFVSSFVVHIWRCQFCIFVKAFVCFLRRKNAAKSFCRTIIFSHKSNKLGRLTSLELSKRLFEQLDMELSLN